MINIIKKKLNEDEIIKYYIVFKIIKSICLLRTC